MEMDPVVSWSDEEIILDEELIEEISPDGGLQPIEQLEEVQPAAPRPTNPIPDPQIEKAPPGRTTNIRNSGSILQASYMETQKPELRAESVRWQKLGLEPAENRETKTRATLRSLD